MELINTWQTLEMRYKYEDEAEKIMHEKTMIDEGFTIVPQDRLPLFMRNNLYIVYEKRELVDDIARL